MFVLKILFRLIPTTRDPSSEKYFSKRSRLKIKRMNIYESGFESLISHREQVATLCRVLRVYWPLAAHKLMLSRFERCVYLGVYLATMPSIPAIKLMYFFAHESITRFPSLRDSRNVLCIFFLFVVGQRGWPPFPR